LWARKKELQGETEEEPSEENERIGERREKGSE